MEVRNRSGISSTALAFALTLVVAVAGVAFYSTFTASKPSNATTSSAAPSSTASAVPPKVTIVPPTPLISPGQTQNYTEVELEPQDSNPEGTLTLRASAPAGVSFILNQTSLSLSGTTQSIPVVLKADPNITPGSYKVTVEIVSNVFPEENKTFTIGVVAELVVMQAVAFHPQNITVSRGTTVTWMNLDSTIGCCDPGNHDVSFLSGVNATSPVMKRYDSWSYTFGTDGVFEYYCSIHPWMKGQVTVAG